MVDTETKTETRIRTIFETKTTRDRPLDVETESLADLCSDGVKKYTRSLTTTLSCTAFIRCIFVQVYRTIYFDGMRITKPKRQTTSYEVHNEFPVVVGWVVSDRIYCQS